MTKNVRAGDSFGLLPGPILEMILVQLDLPSLHNLSRSSYLVFSFLHEEGTARRIIDTIIHLTLPTSVQLLARKFAFLRWAFREWDTRAVGNIAVFIAEFIKCDEEKYSSLPPEMPLSIMFDVLAAAATIRYLVFHILHKMIDRCKKLEFSRLENPKKRYIQNPIRVANPDNLVYAPVPKPPRVRYQQGEMGSVSASEEKIATRALWEIFLIWELRSGVGNTRWTSEERDLFDSVPFEKIWGHSLFNDEMEPNRTMASELFPSLQTVTQRYRAAKSLAHNAGWHYEGDFPPFSLIPDVTKRKYSNRGYSSYLTLSKHYTSPCRYVGFDPYRQYGIAIWDQGRLAALGLDYAKENPMELPQAPRSECDQYVRWESILTAEDLEEIERRRQYYWPGREMVCVENQGHVDLRMNSQY
ncbi:uncharacterized protein N7483_011766 [Penicillium malachiteum]|uniref:uncharacterized protein n=1 Tax=Penicillium malachiteum TaxID=1324776 RepID=UPI0025492B2C|nr:uncharacterized protein N7483_011766 [Penicillium malachiteum]KAJ5714585.1 hypothetical protein N7483_011766 [Penicillium malachiteum]